MTINHPQTVPANSAAALEDLTKAFGWTPNVLNVFAGSPALIQSYQSLSNILSAESAFSETEQEIIQVTNNIENDCTYCMAAHSTVISMKNLLPDDQLEALRSGAPLAENKYNTLRTFALSVLQQQGRVTPAQIETFKAAGYTDEHALEIIVHTAFKVITNFTNNMVEPELDEPFQAQTWSKHGEPHSAGTTGMG